MFQMTLTSLLPWSLGRVTTTTTTSKLVSHVFARAITGSSTANPPLVQNVLRGQDRNLKDDAKTRVKRSAPKGVQTWKRTTVPPRLSRQFLITTKSASSTTEDDVLDKISRIHRFKDFSKVAADGQAIVILATPTFTSWLESQSFLQRTLKLIFTSRGNNNTTALAVTVLLAVVDGIPSPRGTFSPGAPSVEGFAIAYGDQTVLLPELSALHCIPAPDKHDRYALTFLLSPSADAAMFASRTEIDFPLANTLFRNGRKSTMHVSRWERESIPKEFIRISQKETSSAKVKLGSIRVPTRMRMFLPLEPLTVVRKVASGLGNIVRQVVGEDSTPVPASRELEEDVEAYLQARGLERQGVEVWALIIPEKELSMEGLSVARTKIRQKMIQQMTSLDSVRGKWDASEDVSYKQSLGYWLARGAGLYRVLSGGGGWGAKEGLLSLDPETSLSRNIDAGYDFEDPAAGEVFQAEALGNIVKPGSAIQFFIYPHIGPGKPTESTLRGVHGHIDDGSAGHENITSITFGCVPSSIDDIPEAESLGSSSNSTDNLKFIQGHFGAQTESGLFIRSLDKPDPNISISRKSDISLRSKIDVPYSFVRESTLSDMALVDYPRQS